MRRKMRAAVTLLVLGAAIPSVAIAASAATKKYSGPVTGGGTISLKAKVSHGKVTKIESFAYNGIQAQCTKPPNSGTIMGSSAGAQVSHHKFVAKSDDSSGHEITETGTFSSNYKTVTGTIKITGNFLPYRHCSTGTHTWSAKG